MDTLLESFLTNSVSLFIIFGGVLPFIPQYFKIQDLKSIKGFSLLVCFTIIFSNITRICFWLGKHFELPLLLQSILMVIVMLYLIFTCVRYGQIELKNDGQTHSLFDFEASRFWYWSDFSSYLIFTGLLMFLLTLVTLQLKDNSVYIESLGYIATLSESMLTVPQMFENFKERSVKGMSFLMVMGWFIGDGVKTLYFIFRNAPNQFIACGIIQVLFDFILFFQYFTYH